MTTTEPFIRHNVEQGTEDWLALRAGIPTASEFDAIISPEWKARKGQGVETYLAKKLAERWLGYPLASYCGGSMEQGKIMEDEARPYYENMTDTDVERVGFITTLDGRMGASPDGLLAMGGGIEIKCPEPHTHVSYLMGQTVPKDYLAQVHGSILIADAPWWTFMSYCRGFPPLILTVDRNEEICRAIREAVSEFNWRLDHAYELLVKLNGGPPKRRLAGVRADPVSVHSEEEQALTEWLNS